MADNLPVNNDSHTLICHTGGGLTKIGVLRGLNNHARAMSCLCQRTGDAPYSPAYERLDRKTGQLFAVEQPKYHVARMKNIT